MTLVDLTAFRASRTPPPPPYCCPRHVLDELTARIRQRLTTSEALLIPRTELEAAITDLQDTIDRLLPRSEREQESR